jgi:hypothetical protein
MVLGLDETEEILSIFCIIITEYPCENSSVNLKQVLLPLPESKTKNKNSKQLYLWWEKGSENTLHRVSKALLGRLPSWAELSFNYYENEHAHDVT